LAGAEVSLFKKEFHGGKFVVYAWPHASLKEFVMVQMSWLPEHLTRIQICMGARQQKPGI